MKKILTLIGVAVISLAAVINSQAQIPTYYDNFTSFGPIAVATSSNLASPVYIDCSKQQNVGVGIFFKTHVANDSNVVFTIQKTTTGTNWATFATVTVAANGTTPVYFATNYTVAGMKALRVSTVASVNDAGVVTNGYIHYGTKISAP